MDLKRLSDTVVRDHLQLDSPRRPELSVQTFPYESVYTELQAICAALGPKDKVWICDKASCALTQVVPKVREDWTVCSGLCQKGKLNSVLSKQEKLFVYVVTELLQVYGDLCCRLQTHCRENTHMHLQDISFEVTFRCTTVNPFL